MNAYLLVVPPGTPVASWVTKLSAKSLRRWMDTYLLVVPTGRPAASLVTKLSAKSVRGGVEGCTPPRGDPGMPCSQLGDGMPCSSGQTSKDSELTLHAHTCKKDNHTL